MSKTGIWKHKPRILYDRNEKETLNCQIPFDNLQPCSKIKCQSIELT